MAALCAGYSIAVRAKVDSMIFSNFFLAVFWVIVGTNLLFTFGIVAFLKLLRRKKGTYYKAKNFITVSGMYYRMKKSAASLVNICIFSTMVIITLTCTISLYIGIEDVVRFAYPYDYVADFDMGSLARILAYTVLICALATTVFYRGLRRYASSNLMEARM